MLTRATLRRRLTGDKGQKLVPLPWWAGADAAMDDPDVRAVVLWATRQEGKSQYAVLRVAETIVLGSNQYVLFLAAGVDQAQAIIERKLRRPLIRFAADAGLKIRTTKRGVEFPERNTVVEVVAATEDTAPARSVDVLVLDEGRHIDDAVFAAVAPSVIAAGGKILVVSTAGPPRGWFHELATGGDPEVRVIKVDVNSNPHADPKIIGFLSRLLRRILPASAARDLDNVFVEDGDEFLPTALIEAAVDDRLGDAPRLDGPAFAFYDLSRKRDLTSRVVVVRADVRRPEAADHLVVASVRTWDPKDSPTGEVDFAEVRADLADLPRRFPGLATVLIDEGAEAGSLLPFAKAHPRLSLLVQGFVAAPESNMQMWSALAARLHAQTLSIPRHHRLLAELRSLRSESFALGSKWRVVDSSRKLHRDVSLALAGAVFAAGEGVRCGCDTPQCGGLHLFGPGVPVREPAYRPDPLIELMRSTIRDGGEYQTEGGGTPVVIGVARDPQWWAAAMMVHWDERVVLVRHAVVRSQGQLADALRDWAQDTEVQRIVAPVAGVLPGVEVVAGGRAQLESLALKIVTYAGADLVAEAERRDSALIAALSVAAAAALKQPRLMEEESNA